MHVTTIDIREAAAPALFYLRPNWGGPVEASAKDLEFLALAEGYRAFGGIAVSAEMAGRLPGAGISRLARGIVAREVISFEWRGEYWLPRFQFEGEGLTVTADAALLIAELAAALDDSELAQWFVTTNAWLGERLPLQVVPTDFERVHDAARSFRFACRD